MSNDLRNKRSYTKQLLMSFLLFPVVFSQCQSISSQNQEIDDEIDFLTAQEILREEVAVNTEVDDMSDEEEELNISLEDIMIDDRNNTALQTDLYADIETQNFYEFDGQYSLKLTDTLFCYIDKSDKEDEPWHFSILKSGQEIFDSDDLTVNEKEFLNIDMKNVVKDCADLSSIKEEFARLPYSCTQIDLLKNPSVLQDKNAMRACTLSEVYEMRLKSVRTLMWDVCSIVSQLSEERDLPQTADRLYYLVPKAHFLQRRERPDFPFSPRINIKE